MKLIQFLLGILCLTCVIVIIFTAKPEGNFEKIYAILLGGVMLIMSLVFFKKFTS